MKDFFGTEICKGDYLFYAIRSGSVAHAKVGKVIDLKEKAVTIISVKTFWKVVNGQYVQDHNSELSGTGCFMSTDNSIVIPEEKALEYAPILRDV
jgi:hypothetical protein